MTMKDKANKPVTATVTDLDSAARHEAREKQREAELAEYRKRMKEEQKALIEELESVGVHVEFVWDLLKPGAIALQPQAIPVLLHHLQLPYSDLTTEVIARALGVKEAQYAWSVLVDVYKKTREGWGIKKPGDTKVLQLGAKDGLAVALSDIATLQTLGELIALARDPANGESRILLTGALQKRRNKNAQVQAALAELIHDPVLTTQISRWIQWPALVEAYKKAKDGDTEKEPESRREPRLTVKQRLAVALSERVKDDTLDELVSLAKDPVHGESRVLLLKALRRRRNKSAKVQAMLTELMQDPLLKKEIASWPKPRK
ncbi:hypothetical protein XNC1_1085 [Xenorhabdus nematophila ATCC 19061]|uniref:Uncharacterized protein n=1 Tax=Xenorhabdus nematophila (strain ATCC 19061 / DSM 3370 / CCUG 14189 / LMG 1036 / NCIMB 9965 / AN6) TaxID=406817 RepID=D3V8V8_XENNA|nr:hypothetical protein [Xenorhabdus nematophila]CBJ89156.1 hypothetical protein XNC1_1085 [Xenorhabdus nematophila ATCC 19061]CEK22065.1 hypothetical protein XNC2_1069 [Xenorhabdus nematophila AN6/1]